MLFFEVTERKYSKTSCSIKHSNIPLWEPWRQSIIFIILQNW